VGIRSGWDSPRQSCATPLKAPSLPALRCEAGTRPSPPTAPLRPPSLSICVRHPRPVVPNSSPSGKEQRLSPSRAASMQLSLCARPY
jgi:hypothetical protein